MLHRLGGAFVEVLRGTKMPHGDDLDCNVNFARRQEKRVYPFGQTRRSCRAVSFLVCALG